MHTRRFTTFAFLLITMTVASVAFHVSPVNAQTEPEEWTEIEIDDDDGTIHDSINSERIIDVSATTTTPNKPLLSFSISIGGTSDVQITKFPVSFVVTGAEHADDMIYRAHLFRDGVRIAMKNVPVDADKVIFDGLNLTLPTGSESVFQIRGDFLPTSGALDDGDTIATRFGENETDSADFDPKNAQGVRVPDSDIDGNALAGRHITNADGIRVRHISASSTLVGTPMQSGRYVMKYEIISTKRDLYIPASIGRMPTEHGFAFTSYYYGSASSTITSVASVTSDATREGKNFIVRKGERKIFTATVTLSPYREGLYGVEGIAVHYRIAPTSDRKKFTLFGGYGAFKPGYLSIDPTN